MLDTVTPVPAWQSRYPTPVPGRPWRWRPLTWC